jgi:hypothetical protein
MKLRGNTPERRRLDGPFLRIFTELVVGFVDLY